MNIKPSLLIGLWLMSAASHLPAQTFKGHHIGETTAEFLASEPVIRKKLDDCRADVPRALTLDEIQQQYGKKGLQDFLKLVATDKAAVANGEASRHPRVMSLDFDLYGEMCGGVIDSFSDGNGQIDGVGFGFWEYNSHSMSISERIKAQPMDAEWNRALESGDRANLRMVDPTGRYFDFEHGLLASISVKLSDHLLNLRDDITIRVGVSPTSLSIPMHNAFGATWDDITYIWDTDQIHVRLTQKNNPAEPTPADLSVESRSLYLEQEAKKKAVPNPLD
jgi:hypothetical protein